ncbi:hypothetical protein GBA52_024341 [Prunus armeniaca]|nr:hypothetical protein GBA52_024341 [Prunus armeniaca]
MATHVICHLIYFNIGARSGLSGASLAHTICRNPDFLTASLENTLIPGFKRELLSDEKIVNVIKRSSWGILAWYAKNRRTSTKMRRLSVWDSTLRH